MRRLRTGDENRFVSLYREKGLAFPLELPALL
jgi:hypothetical protein